MTAITFKRISPDEARIYAVHLLMPSAARETGH